VFALLLICSFVTQKYVFSHAFLITARIFITKNLIGFCIQQDGHILTWIKT